MKKIGITTTVPIEVIYAAGYIPVDLNNVFITSNDYTEYIDIAERDGFPKSMCAWIKGIYGAIIANNITQIIGVMEGDCSNTKALIEVLKQKGIKVYPFSYPHSHNYDDIKFEINKLMTFFNVDIIEVEKTRKELNVIRDKVKLIDVLTTENMVSGFENHLYQVSCSDFNGDYIQYSKEIDNKLIEFSSRKPNNYKLNIGYIGVPPMLGDLYEYLESLDANVVFNEVQREFAFPRASSAKNIYEQYHDYTYPYDLEFRLIDLKKQIKDRKLDAIIHYTQAFCYRAVEDIVLKKELNIPMINIEGDKLNILDARTKLRLEAFIDMLKDIKNE